MEWYDRYDILFTPLLLLYPICSGLGLLESLHHSLLALNQVLRMFRISRILCRIPVFATMLPAMRSMIPAGQTFASTMVIIVYMFSAVGVICFGGIINTDPDGSAGERRVADTDFGKSAYYTVCNFNDMLNGMLYLFVLLTQNDYGTHMDAFVTAAESEWARLYFVMYFLGEKCMIRAFRECRLTQLTLSHSLTHSRARSQWPALLVWAFF